MRLEKGTLSGLSDDNGSFLREITVGDEEVFRGVGFVVRDDKWGTPALAGAARLSEAGDSLRVESSGELAIVSGDLAWSIVWTLAETALEARVEWSSRSGFLTNRTGFVILHSLGASRGRAVRVTHTDGLVENASFPRFVSPHQPFFDIAAMDYETTAGNRLRIAVGGKSSKSRTSAIGLTHLTRPIADHCSCPIPIASSRALAASRPSASISYPCIQASYCGGCGAFHWARGADAAYRDELAARAAR